MLLDFRKLPYSIVILLILLLSLYALPSFARNYAILIAGSSGYGNYRHQSDISHYYSYLRHNGYGHDDIVTFSAHDIVYNDRNHFRGQIFNAPCIGCNGIDYEHTLHVDYNGNNVTWDNIKHVLLHSIDGEKQNDQKVLPLTKNDTLLFFFADHGATGLLELPYDKKVSVKEFNDLLVKLITKNVVGRIITILEACESGSMCQDVVPLKPVSNDKSDTTSDRVLCMTATNSVAPSFAKFCMDKSVILDTNMDTCLADDFAYSIIDYLEKNLGQVSNPVGDKPVNEPTLGDLYEYLQVTVGDSPPQLFSTKTLRSLPLRDVFTQPENPTKYDEQTEQTDTHPDSSSSSSSSSPPSQPPEPEHNKTAFPCIPGLIVAGCTPNDNHNDDTTTTTTTTTTTATTTTNNNDNNINISNTVQNLQQLHKDNINPYSQHHQISAREISLQYNLYEYFKNHKDNAYLLQNPSLLEGKHNPSNSNGKSSCDYCEQLLSNNIISSSVYDRLVQKYNEQEYLKTMLDMFTFSSIQLTNSVKDINESKTLPYNDEIDESATTLSNQLELYTESYKAYMDIAHDTLINLSKSLHFGSKLSSNSHVHKSLMTLPLTSDSFQNNQQLLTSHPDILFALESSVSAINCGECCELNYKLILDMPKDNICHSNEHSLQYFRLIHNLCTVMESFDTKHIIQQAITHHCH